MSLKDDLILVENKAKEEISWINKFLPLWAKTLIAGLVVGFIIGVLL